MTDDRVGPPTVDVLTETSPDCVAGTMPFTLSRFFEAESPATFEADGVWEVDKERVPEDSTNAEPLCGI